MLPCDDEESLQYFEPFYRKVETTIAWINDARTAATTADAALRRAVEDLGPHRECRETRRAYAKIVVSIAKVTAKLDEKEAQARRELAILNRYTGRPSGEGQQSVKTQ